MQQIVREFSHDVNDIKYRVNMLFVRLHYEIALNQLIHLLGSTTVLMFRMFFIGFFFEHFIIRMNAITNGLIACFCEQESVAASFN